MARRRNSNPFVPLLIGGVLGGAAALVMAPVSGRETRTNISNGVNRALFKANEQRKTIITDAQVFAKDMLDKAGDIYNKSINYAEGKYTASADSIDLEIRSIKNALDAAVVAYKDTKAIYKHSDFSGPSEIPEVAVTEMHSDLEDESLPKHEGMGRRVE